MLHLPVSRSHGWCHQEFRRPGSPSELAASCPVSLWHARSESLIHQDQELWSLPFLSNWEHNETLDLLPELFGHTLVCCKSKNLVQFRKLRQIQLVVTVIMYKPCLNFSAWGKEIKPNKTLNPLFVFKTLPHFSIGYNAYIKLLCSWIPWNTPTMHSYDCPPSTKKWLIKYASL